jgi:hypothetical protein
MHRSYEDILMSGRQWEFVLHGGKFIVICIVWGLFYSHGKHGVSFIDWIMGYHVGDLDFGFFGKYNAGIIIHFYL